MAPHREQIYTMPNLILNEIKTDINQFDVHFTSGVVRRDVDYGPNWWVYPRFDFPWQLLEYHHEVFWFRLGPYEYNEALQVAQKMDRELSNCLEYFYSISLEVGYDENEEGR